MSLADIKYLNEAAAAAYFICCQTESKINYGRRIFFRFSRKCFGYFFSFGHEVDLRCWRSSEVVGSQPDVVKGMEIMLVVQNEP